MAAARLRGFVAAGFGGRSLFCGCGCDSREVKNSRGEQCGDDQTLGIQSYLLRYGEDGDYFV